MPLNMDCELEQPSWRGQLHIRQWEETSFRSNGTCLVYRLRKSLFSLDISEYQTSRQKRLAIDLSALKQLIWHNRDDCDEEVDGSKVNFPRWIDTSAMLSACLTRR